MRNYKKPTRNLIGEGKANQSQINVLNPDETKLVMRGKEWVNPNTPNYNDASKKEIHTIMQQNKD
jgi:hypothetical protein